MKSVSMTSRCSIRAILAILHRSQALTPPALPQFAVTSSVSYCAPPGAIRVDRFQVVYFRDNQSIGFDIIAQSVEANVNPILDFSLNAYGLNPINLTFDLCSVASGVLCPLPQYNFSGELLSFILLRPASAGVEIPWELARVRGVPNPIRVCPEDSLLGLHRA